METSEKERGKTGIRKGADDVRNFYACSCLHLILCVINLFLQDHTRV